MGIDYRKLRQATGLSVEKFAMELGASTQTVAQWEDGSNAPTPVEQKKIFAVVKKYAEAGQGMR